MLSDPKTTAQSDVPMDTVWSILEAANELGDTHTVEACRRVIDAELNGTVPGSADTDLVLGYFR